MQIHVCKVSNHVYSNIFVHTRMLASREVSCHSLGGGKGGRKVGIGLQIVPHGRGHYLLRRANPLLFPHLARMGVGGAKL